MSANKPKLLILMDWQPGEEWAFRTVLERSFATHVIAGSAPKSFQSTLEKVFRVWKSYFEVAFRGFCKMRHFDIVYAWHAVIGLYFAALCRLFAFKKPRIVIGQLIVPDKAHGLSQRLKLAFTRFALKRIDLVVVFSKVEAELFQKRFENGHTRFLFAPVGIDMPDATGVKSNGYIFSGGRSNRDYATLIAAARDLPYQVHIAAQRFNIGATSLPENVIAHYDAFGDKFTTLLKEAALVVIPLDRPDESSGQLVLLQAMALGKATVVSNSRGISDYVKSGQSSITVALHDVAALKSAIVEMMESPDKRSRFENEAKKQAANFTISNQAKHVEAILQKLVRDNKA